MIFKEIAPIILFFTLVFSAFILLNIKKTDAFTIEGIFALIGSGLGLTITSLNLIYSNNYLITIGPLLTIASLLFLRFRSNVLTGNLDFSFNFDEKKFKLIRIFYWISILIALISYYHATVYYRPPIFFISLSIAITALGLEIVASRFDTNVDIFKIMSKILLVSLLLRFSAYFVSPYPVGSDPWGHADMIDVIYHLGTIENLDRYTYYGEYYGNYPLMHIYTSMSKLLADLSLKQSMSIIGMILPFSTLFVYLIIKSITNKTNIALLSMLMINFADFHIQWSIETIPMTFGIAIYTIILYLLLSGNRKNQIMYSAFSILFIFTMIWTHTVSSFITLVSIISLYVGGMLFKLIYNEKKHLESSTINFGFCILVFVILIYHWMDPGYSFFDITIERLINSLSMEAGFLERTSISNVEDSFGSILNIAGFLIFIFFGILGSLFNLSGKNVTKTKFSLIFMLVVLYFIFFVFPLMGIRNIMPYRWPAFIYLTFVLFVVVGITNFSKVFGNKKYNLVFISIFFLLSSFFMIGNSFTNMDSPIYGAEINQKLVWTDSEIKLFNSINDSYDDTIVADLQTVRNQFDISLDRDNVVDYPSTPEGDLNWDYMEDKLLIWRKVSLNRPVQIHGHKNPRMLLGSDFKTNLDENFNGIYDTGTSKAYLGNK
ncbi:MAG: hypothetical protein ACFFG0_12045 [Candidatus Thorarchaeota archaeon]